MNVLVQNNYVNVRNLNTNIGAAKNLLETNGVNGIQATSFVNI